MCDCNLPRCIRRSAHSSAVEAVRRRIDHPNSHGNLTQPAGASVMGIEDKGGPSRPSGVATVNTSTSTDLTLQIRPPSTTTSDNSVVVDDAHQVQQQNSNLIADAMDTTPSFYDVNDAPTPRFQQQSRAGNMQNAYSNSRTPRNIQNQSENGPLSFPMNTGVRGNLCNPEFIRELYENPAIVHYPHFHPKPNTEKLAKINVNPANEGYRLLYLPGGSKYNMGLGDIKRNPYPPNGEYADERKRLESFKKWSNWSSNPSRLAFAGFYYHGTGDNVECFSCRMKLNGWDSVDPVLTHIRLANQYCEHLYYILTNSHITLALGAFYDWSPPAEMNPQWVKPLEVKNIINRHGGPVQKQFNNAMARLDSFTEKKWEEIPGYPSKEELAEQGFSCASRSMIKCYYCGKRILLLSDVGHEQLMPADVHSLYFPQCFLSRVRDMPAPAPILWTPHIPARNGIDSPGQFPRRVDPTRPACRICDEYEGNILAIDCGHILGCMNCLLKFKTNQCPFCRADIGSVMPIYT